VKLGLLALSASLLFLSFAPFKQFYLAWFAFAPMLLVWMDARSAARAAGWGWCAGLLFFLPNFSYLFLTTLAGTLALAGYEALFWSMAATAIRAVSGFRSPLWCVVSTAAVWVAFDWLRGNSLFALPWLYFGYTQSPALALCQVADFGGVYGVTFCIVLVNALIAIALRTGMCGLRTLMPAAVTTGVNPWRALRARNSRTRAPWRRGPGACDRGSRPG